MTTADELVQRMTLEEKAALCVGVDAWSTLPLTAFGLRGLRFADGPHGVRRVEDPATMVIRAAQATCFPTASCTGSTWDPDLLREMGQAIGREAAAVGVDVILGPGVNLKRSPLGGRNFEYFSEDPHLAGELAVGWIEGIQSEGVGASLKHFAVNNQEHRRMTISAEVDERTLRELYLGAFEAAVTRARPWTVMCAYNKVNGTYASEHHDLLTGILRDEWSFDGVVVSDWGAVHDRVASLAAGLDLEMPGPRPRRVDAIVEAVRSGALGEDIVDRAVERIIALIQRASERPRGRAADLELHHGLARRLAAAGMVLLKNDGVLPLPRGQRLAIIGTAARDPILQGGGSSHITPTRVDVPFDEIARVADASTIKYADGYPADDATRPDLIEQAVEVAMDADTALLFVALPTWKEREGRDRTELELSTQQIELIRAVTAVQPRTVVVLNNGSPVTVSPWIDSAAAVLEAWLPGQAGGGAIADVLIGHLDPSGRLAETFPIRLEDTPAYLDHPDEDVVRYAEGAHIGYRWYESRDMPVAFPFGFGLSYATFEYANVAASTDRIDDEGGVTVSVDVTNTSQRAGAEVVQVYVRRPATSARRRPKELKGFVKVLLDPGATRTVAIALDRRSFRSWDARRRTWVTEDGTAEILVGASSRDIRGSIPIRLVGSTGLPSVVDESSPPEDWLADSRGRQPMLDLMRRLAPVLNANFGDGGSDGQPVFDDFLMQMPLADILEVAQVTGVDLPGTLEHMLATLDAPQDGAEC